MGHNSSKPASPTMPADATKVVDAIKTAEAAKPVIDVKPVTEAKPVVEAKPAEPTKPVETKKVETAKPVETKKADAKKADSPVKKVDPLTNYTPKYDVIKKMDDAHYGEVALVKEQGTNKEMLLKRVVANSKEGFEAELHICQQRAAFKNNNVVQVIGYTHEEKKSFCSNFHSIDIFVENYEKTLFDKIQAAMVNQVFFSEDEILFIAENMISCLAYFQHNGVHHGDIRPFNIFVGADSYKLSDPTLAAQKNFNGYYAALFEGKKTLLAPEFLKKLAEKQMTVQVGSKSDAFALGATLLSLATLTNSEDFCNYERGLINEVLLHERLEKVRARYSLFTYNLIKDMLVLDEEHRVDFITLEARLLPYRDQIVHRNIHFITSKTMYGDDDILRRVAEQLARSQELRASIEKGHYYHTEVVAHQENGKVMY